MTRGAWTAGAGADDAGVARGTDPRVGTTVTATLLDLTRGGAVAGEFGACGATAGEGAAGVGLDTTGALGAATAACEPIQVAKPRVEMAAAAKEPFLHRRRRLN